MNKEKYIQQELLKTTQSFIRILLSVGALAILILIILDYFATPEHFEAFLIYRVIAAFLYIALFLIYKKVNKLHLIFLTLGTLIVSIMVELMILSLGGHQSAYYAGFIIISIFLFGLVPISLKSSLFLASIIYGTYLLPILVFDKITNLHIFFNNNIFFAENRFCHTYIASSEQGNNFFIK